MFSKLPFVFIVMTLLAAGCVRKAIDSPAESSGAPDSIIHISSSALRSGEIATETLVERPLADTLILTGEIAPNPLSVAHVSARVAGNVQGVRVVVGDRVTAGQTLATLYSPEFLAIAADYLLAHRRAEAAVRGGSPDTGSLEAVALSSRHRLEMLGAPPELIGRLHESHEVANELPLLSPAAGVVTEVEAAPGKHVEAGADMFGITNLSGVWAVTHAYERDLGRLHIGQPSEIVASAFPGRFYSGSVTSLEGAIDEATRTLKVRLSVRNPDLSLRPGMFVNARIATGERRNALVVSEGSVQEIAQEKVVFVALGETTFVARPVTVHPLGGNLLEILTGVRAGERLASTGAFLIKSQALKGELGEE